MTSSLFQQAQRVTLSPRTVEWRSPPKTETMISGVVTVLWRTKAPGGTQPVTAPTWMVCTITVNTLRMLTASTGELGRGITTLPRGPRWRWDLLGSDDVTTVRLQYATSAGRCRFSVGVPLLKCIDWMTTDWQGNRWDRHTEGRLTDWQTDRQTDRQTDGQRMGERTRDWQTDRW